MQNKFTLKILLSLLICLLGIPAEMMAQEAPHLPVVTTTDGRETWQELQPDQRQIAVVYVERMAKILNYKLRIPTNSALTSAWVLTPTINQAQVTRPNEPGWAKDTEPTYAAVALQYENGYVAWAGFEAEDIDIALKNGARRYKFSIRQGWPKTPRNFLLWKRRESFKVSGFWSSWNQENSRMGRKGNDPFDTNYARVKEIEVWSIMDRLTEVKWKEK